MDRLHLIVSMVLAGFALWDAVDTHQGRGQRFMAGLIAAGALSNVVGLTGALFGVSGASYENVWPGECVVSVGVILLFWVRRHPKGVPPQGRANHG